MGFFLLTFALSWTCFGALAVLARSGSMGVAGYALLLAGTFAPSIVAVWLTYRERGSTGVTALLERILRWQVGARWYLFAVATVPGCQACGCDHVLRAHRRLAAIRKRISRHHPGGNGCFDAVSSRRRGRM